MPTVVALLVVALAVLGLAAMALVALPLAILLEVTVLALVAGTGMRLRRMRRPRREGARAGPRWTTGWESEPLADAVPVVRGRLAVVLDEWGLTGEAAEPTLLVVTELVSNAAEHGRAPVRLAVELRGDAVRVEVYDGSPEQPRRRPHDPARDRGRGLLLVDGLSGGWGWIPSPPGKVVWAEVATEWPE
ncbi:ATP-binding protein [Pseudonocardia humida]|uniref:ATP-binding protein n=1 Tax=Pseudonocardia humida TaxID=2800819 RepID=A0ABT1A751_9PSEU|nr:ATP-binding protein [Pseudonocardia humida]MCO1658840.1 ATP-binding protein [Pseudonocardia humida]